MFSGAVAKCFAGEVIIPAESMLQTVFREKKKLIGRDKGGLPLKFHPTIIHQPEGVVFSPSKGCVNYGAQAQEATESAKPSTKRHGHSHANDKLVIIVPEISTGGKMSGPSSTPCGDGAHDHEHSHEVSEASNGQITHFGCHRIDVPHTHVTNGNELSAEPKYPAVTPSMSYK